MYEPRRVVIKRLAGPHKRPPRPDLSCTGLSTGPMRQQARGPQAGSTHMPIGQCGQPAMQRDLPAAPLDAPTHGRALSPRQHTQTHTTPTPTTPKHKYTETIRTTGGVIVAGDGGFVHTWLYRGAWGRACYKRRDPLAFLSMAKLHRLLVVGKMGGGSDKHTNTRRYVHTAT